MKLTSRNLKFTIGNKTELWNKVMNEVKEKRYAGPFANIPYQNNYIQSPIGLVPKDGGRKTRLIFHLSYPRKDKHSKQLSVNANTPEHMMSVQYPSFDDAIKLCNHLCAKNTGLQTPCYLGKSDMSSAFRHFAIAIRFWRYLIMKARNPVDRKYYFFVDKCMPFGAAISCSHFQRFSNAVAHVIKCISKADNVNYLDDYLFGAILRNFCNSQLQLFIDTCDRLKFPISMEKTVWASTRIVFLGLLIDTVLRMVFIPMDKIQKALTMVNWMMRKRTVTIKQLQSLTGFLNFLCKCVVPGRAFNRRLYSLATCGMKDNLHVNVTREVKQDLLLWQIFLSEPTVFNRRFMEFDTNLTALELFFYTDASSTKGCGGVFNDEWFIMEWEDDIFEHPNYYPSINYLELYALTIGILNWACKFRNQFVTIFCDNMSVIHMVNSNTSKCAYCMDLIRIIVLHSMIMNVRIKAVHVPTHLNIYADSLSRLDYKRFRAQAKKQNRTFKSKPTPIPDKLVPMTKLWNHT